MIVDACGTMLMNVMDVKERGITIPFYEGGEIMHIVHVGRHCLAGSRMANVKVGVPGRGFTEE